MNSQQVLPTRVTLRIPTEIYTKAKARADAEHISLNSFIVRAIERATQKKVKP